MTKELPNPALLLKSPRHEALCQNLAKGMSLSDGYIHASGGKGKPGSAKVSAHRIKSKPIFQQRLSFLIQQERQRQNIALNATTDLPDSFGKNDIAQLFVEVLETLEQAYQIALNSAVPPIRLEQLRATMASHGARMNTLQEDGGEVPESADPYLARDIEVINAMEMCRCQS